MREKSRFTADCDAATEIGGRDDGGLLIPAAVIPWTGATCIAVYMLQYDIYKISD